MLCGEYVMANTTKTDSLGQFEQLVLTAVATLRKNAYSVPIHARVSELSGKPVNLGSVYVSLDRLQAKGYVSSWLADPTSERGGKSKRYYAVEKAGDHALSESAATAKRMVDILKDSGKFGKWKRRRNK